MGEEIQKLEFSELRVICQQMRYAVVAASENEALWHVAGRWVMAIPDGLPVLVCNRELAPFAEPTAIAVFDGVGCPVW